MRNVDVFLAAERGSGTLAGVILLACRCRSLPIRSALFAAVLGLALAPAGASAASRGESDVQAWVGRHCTPLGCRGPSDSALGNAVGFATASAAIFLIRRRRA